MRFTHGSGFRVQGLGFSVVAHLGLYRRLMRFTQGGFGRLHPLFQQVLSEIWLFQ